MPSFVDWPWVFLWFGIGLLSFWIPKEIPEVKKLLSVFSIILLFSLLKAGTLNGEIIIDEVITSLVSSPVYLIGADISRTVVFRIPPSPKIVVYIFTVVILAGSFG
jgi:hypothetical protein